MGLAEARIRIEETKSIYRRLMHVQVPDGTWDWWLRNEIAEAEEEISASIAKMTAGQGDHLGEDFVYQLPPVYTPLPLIASQEVSA